MLNFVSTVALQMNDSAPLLHNLSESLRKGGDSEHQLRTLQFLCFSPMSHTHLTDLSKIAPLSSSALHFTTLSVLMLLINSNLVLAHTPQCDFHLFPKELQTPLNGTGLSINLISYSTRAHWMRAANSALGTPCPFAAFGTVIVNHTAKTADGLGQLVCTGANRNYETGNPVQHGEIVAITNCSAILIDPAGPYKLTPAAALSAFKDLSLYTNAESCPMCAAAIRWAGFKEYVYGTSIEMLIRKGWSQIRISSEEVFRESSDLPLPTRLIGNVLTNETDPQFLWQSDPSYPCPNGCVRSKRDASCLS